MTLNLKPIFISVSLSIFLSSCENQAHDNFIYKNVDNTDYIKERNESGYLHIWFQDMHNPKTQDRFGFLLRDETNNESIKIFKMAPDMSKKKVDSLVQNYFECGEIPFLSK